MESLDRTDRDILALLQADGRLTGAEVGRRVGISQPAAGALIQRLEKNGVITGYRAVVAPAAPGLNIHAVIRLRTTHAQLARALDFASRPPEDVGTDPRPSVSVMLRCEPSSPATCNAACSPATGHPGRDFSRHARIGTDPLLRTRRWPRPRVGLGHGAGATTRGRGFHRVDVRTGAPRSRSSRCPGPRCR
ncbi:Lrp/AsnC family transcriptional regulator [Streptomyces sp. NPDC046727]|uniref:Lrp/AsnC family transcriptional regulator n=1 Tax=Streptomyces sp. NPDC046727 TaxID=3155373 RepID=UPI0033EE919D